MGRDGKKYFGVTAVKTWCCMWWVKAREEIRDDSQIFGLSNCIDGGAVY